MKNFYIKAILLISFFALFSKTVNAQTYVNGHITSNTTWTLANGPYIVLDTVFVDAGNTLTIEPGVTVKFENDKSIKLINANLIAEGTINDSIIFTTNYPFPALGLWKGIIFNSSSINPQNTIAKFNYCNMLYSANGIEDLTAGPTNVADSVQIRNSFFNYNSCGITQYGYSNYLIDSCLFINNGLAVFLNCQGFSLTAASIIKNSIFSYNNDGVNIGIVSHAISEIQNCRIENSTNVGIIDYQSTQTLRIKDCIIRKNNMGIEPGYNTSIMNCIVDSNTMTGILVDNGKANIIGCTIKNNDIGVENIQGSQGIIAKNVIENNNIGIHQQSNGGDSIYCNKIANNNNYNLKNSNVFYPVSVSNNDWGTNDTALISVGIYDGHDDPNVSVVSFLPIDTVQCYQSPCNIIISESTTNATCPTCADGHSTAHVFNGFAPYTYSWNTSPAQSLLTAVNLLPGNYTVCATDIYGCSACDNFSVLSGSCSAYFNFYADTVPHSYLVQNLAHGTGVLTYSWDWGDGSPNDFTAFPSHIYSTPGFYTICQTIADATGCTNQYCNTYSLQHSTNTVVYVNVIGGTATGLQTQSLENDFTLYPNPASALVTIMFADNKTTDLKILNLLGETVYKIITNSQKNIIDIKDFPPGVYIIEAGNGSAVLRRKFVKN